MALEYQEISVEGYERIVRVQDKTRGLDAIISIHNTALGPALGGTRIFPYVRFEDALNDVLRLSKGMTYKSAMAETGLGGGKSVIIADAKRDKTPELFQAFGEAVNSLKGKYICAEDVGCTTADCLLIRQSTPYVTGLPTAASSGNPAPFTAWGVFRGIQACSQFLDGTDSLAGKTVAVQGLGSVGRLLVDHLFWAGAHLIVADIDQDRVAEVVSRYGAKAVSVDEILFQKCDILSPCAMGGIINSSLIPKLGCRILAGAANNPLLHDTDAELLRLYGILYAPDFVINAGGLINVTLELVPTGYDPQASRDRIASIYSLLLSIFEISKRNKCSTLQATTGLADYRLKYGIGRRTQQPHFPPV